MNCNKMDYTFANGGEGNKEEKSYEKTKNTRKKLQKNVFNHEITTITSKGIAYNLINMCAGTQK